MRGYKFLLTSLLISSFAAIFCTDCYAVKEESSMRYISNDRIKLGIDLALGGAVTYLSDQANGGKNMINSFDWGRQIQMSYYSGPWPYIGPNGEKPTPEWEGLGWNPIQSGDAGGHRSKIISFEKIGNYSMLVKSIPMQWPHKTGVAGECAFECLYTLKGNVIAMKATIINNRPDKTQYTACSQEMPAVYTNGNWYKIVSYLGDKPFEGKPTTTIVDKTDKKGWPWVHFYTPENWVALLDDKGYGIGVFQPQVMTFNSGFHSNDSLKGFGGEKDVQTGHIAPIGQQILDYNIKWTYETSLILGTLEDIRGYAKKHWQIAANPRWNFKNSRDNWYYYGNMTDSGFPLKGGLDITFKKNSALVSPVTFWKAAETPYLEIEGEINTPDKELLIEVEIQPTGKSDLTDWLNWTEGEHNMENERKAKAANFPESPAISLQHKIVADGTSKKYQIKLSDIKGYTGAMKNLKIKFLNDGKAKIKSIQLK